MWGYLGLVTAFLLLAGVLSWILISSKANMIVKALLIAFTMWYGIALYYTPGNIMGWPTNIQSFRELPEGSWVVSMWAKEPNKSTNQPGALFIVLVDFSKDKDKFQFSIDPRTAFKYKGSTDPRIFKIPYDRNKHKDMEEAKKKVRSGGGMIRISHRKATQGKPEDENHEEDSVGAFDIVDPKELLKKAAEKANAPGPDR